MYCSVVVLCVLCFLFFCCCCCAVSFVARVCACVRACVCVYVYVCTCVCLFLSVWCLLFAGKAVSHFLSLLGRTIVALLRVSALLDPLVSREFFFLLFSFFSFLSLFICVLSVLFLPDVLFPPSFRCRWLVGQVG